MLTTRAFQLMINGALISIADFIQMRLNRDAEATRQLLIIIFTSRYLFTIFAHPSMTALRDETRPRGVEKGIRSSTRNELTLHTRQCASFRSQTILDLLCNWVNSTLFMRWNHVTRRREQHLISSCDVRRSMKLILQISHIAVYWDLLPCARKVCELPTTRSCYWVCFLSFEFCQHHL